MGARRYGISLRVFFSISSSKLEEKFHISKQPCIVLLIISIITPVIIEILALSLAENGVIFRYNHLRRGDYSGRTNFRLEKWVSGNIHQYSLRLRRIIVNYISILRTKEANLIHNDKKSVAIDSWHLIEGVSHGKLIFFEVLNRLQTFVLQEVHSWLHYLLGHGYTN